MCIVMVEKALLRNSSSITTVSTDSEHVCMCHASEDMEAEPIWGASFRKFISEIGTTCRSLSFVSL